MMQVNLLSISNSPWSTPYWTSRQFLSYELARYANVAYAIERPELRNVTRWLAIQFRRREAPFAPPTNLQVMPQFWPRTHRYKRLDQLLLHAYTRQLQRALDRGTGKRGRVIYVWNPGRLEIVKRLSYDLLIYHPYDMFSFFDGFDSQSERQELELCRMADVLITPHRQIAERLEHPCAHVVPNGVFMPAFPSGPIEADGKAGMDRPLIGYFGAYNKVDYQLLLEIFSERPEWQLEIVGFKEAGDWSDSPAYKSLKNLGNVRFMDGVPIDRAAPVIARFDVGLCPYNLSTWMQFCESPLKLYQYWAMGVPVVCSPLPNLSPIDGAIEICRTSEEWRTGIELQLALQSPQLRAALRHRAENHSWTHLAGRVFHIIEESLSEKLKEDAENACRFAGLES
jgi:glycosyltransferase involved in cell wall biosynthesis